MRARKLEEENFDITTINGFNRLYDLYASKVFGFLMHNLQDEMAAEDLLQDLFTDTWQRRYEIKVRDSLEKYLISACKYKLIDFYRKADKVSDLEQVKPRENSSITPEDWVIFSQSKSRMFAIFNKMPVRTKEIFLLSRKQGLSNKEVAKNLKVSEKTVEYHISKTLKLLRTYFFIFF
ncbi:MAG: sigma-70 family RNA polymerase sigma factor [Bacteroidota bacterium]